MDQTNTIVWRWDNPTHSEPTSPMKTGGGYLRFINGPYHYIVYAAIGKDWGAKDGVAVEKNNQGIANLECQDIPVSNLSEEFFTRAGLSADQDEFQIPGID